MSSWPRDRRALRRPLAARAAWAAVLSFVVLLSGGAVAHAAPSGAVISTEEAAAEQAEMVLAPDEPLLLEEEEEYRFRVRIDNSGDETMPGGRVTLELGTQRVTAEAELDEEFPDSGVPLAEAGIGEIRAGSSQTIVLSVQRDDVPQLVDLEQGVYRIRAALIREPETDGVAGEDAGDAVVEPAFTAVSTVVWKGVGRSASVNLSAIVPVVLPSDIRTLPTRDQLAQLAPGFERLLDTAAANHAVLAIDPRVIAGIRAYGDAAPESARSFLERLETSRLQSFLLQFADADPAAQAALGFDELMQPLGLDFVTRFGEFPATVAETEDPPATTGEGDEGETGDAPADGDDGAADETGAGEAGTGEAGGGDADGTGAGDAGSAEQSGSTDAAGDPDTADSAAEGINDAEETDPGVDPDANPGIDPDADPDAPGEPPTLEQLLAWPQGLAGAWPAEGEVDDATLALLRRSGIDTVVLSSGNVAHDGGPGATLGASTALITDEALGDAARRALTGGSETARAAGFADTATLLALTAQQRSPGLILGLDRGAVADADNPGRLFERLAELEWVTFIEAKDQRTGTATLRSAETREERREVLRGAAGREASIEELGDILVHPEYLSGYQRARLLEIFATRYAADEDRFADAAQRFRERDAELLSGVSVVATEHTQLVGTSTQVPLQLRNSMPFDAVVDVSVSPTSAGLSIAERAFPEVVVPADGGEQVLVPVRSRVSSGESGLSIRITDVGGERSVFVTTLDISIRSAVETIALWTLGALALLLLGFGTWRSVRRRMRARGRAGGAADAADAAEADSDAAAEDRGEAATEGGVEGDARAAAADRAGSGAGE